MTVQPDAPRLSAFQEPLRNANFLGTRGAEERPRDFDQVRFSPDALEMQQQGPQAAERQQVPTGFWNALSSDASRVAWGDVTGPSGTSLLGQAPGTGGLRPSGTGQGMAKAAERHARGRGGRCFKYVADVLDRFGVVLSGRSAWMAAGQLARNPKMAEVKGLKNEDLKKLPAGAVVVWNRGNGHAHGHISISLGDGREASDIIRRQATQYGTSFRVFAPRDMLR